MDLNNSARGEALLAKSISGLLGVEERGLLLALCSALGQLGGDQLTWAPLSLGKIRSPRPPVLTWTRHQESHRSQVSWAEAFGSRPPEPTWTTTQASPSIILIPPFI